MCVFLKHARTRRLRSSSNLHGIFFIFAHIRLEIPSRASRVSHNRYVVPTDVTECNGFEWCQNLPFFTIFRAKSDSNEIKLMLKKWYKSLKKIGHLILNQTVIAQNEMN